MAGLSSSVASFIYLKWKRLDVTKYFDALAPYVLGGQSDESATFFPGRIWRCLALPWAINAFGTRDTNTNL